MSCLGCLGFAILVALSWPLALLLLLLYPLLWLLLLPLRLLGIAVEGVLAGIKALFFALTRIR
ncbi:MAG: hypothetical protein Q8N36_04700 [bacterium]|nr:hypothetical protein [bacterium]